MPSSYDQFISQLEDVARITEIARRLGIEVHQRNNAPVALCPFHDDNRPSLRFYERSGGGTRAKDHFHCFACGAHGDVFTLVKDFRSIDFWTSVKWIADELGLAVPKRTGGPSAEEPDSARGFKLALETYKKQSVSHKVAFSEFASRRGFSVRFLEKAEVFWAQANSVSNSINVLSERDAYEAALAAGIIRPPVAMQAQKLAFNLPNKDMFSTDRIVLAIRDAEGRLAGFAGRSINDSDHPKYLFTPGFAKAETLYRLHEVRKRLIGNETRQSSNKIEKDTSEFHVFIVEGLFDALRLEKLGLNALAVLGSRFSDGQLALITQLASEAERVGKQLSIHLFLDNDEAGRTGTNNAIPRLFRAASENTPFGIDVIDPLATPLPKENVSNEPTDPDDLLRNFTKQQATSKLKSWNTSAIGFLAASILGVSSSDLNEEWLTSSPAHRIQTARKIERLLSPKQWDVVLARLEPFNKWYSSTQDMGVNWEREIRRYLELASPLSQAPTSQFSDQNELQLSDSAKLLHALQLAESSTQRREVPLDDGTWRRLKGTWDVSAKIVAEQFKQERPEPLMGIEIPRLDGRFRLKALPAPEDLTAQQYVLNELLKSRGNPRYTESIPAVRFYRDSANGNGKLETTGAQSQLPANGETVSFAYQVDMDVIEGQTPPRKEGMFRPYYDCWCEFIRFIDGKVIGNYSNSSARLHVARLDVRRFYDSLPRFAVHGSLVTGLRAGIGALPEDEHKNIAKLLPQNDRTDRAGRLVDWMCNQSFGYAIWQISNGEVATSSSPNTGIPQGPDLSAYLANVSLFGVDHAASNAAVDLGAIYARYVDDMVIVATSSESLADLRAIIERELAKLHLELSPKLDPLQPMTVSEVRNWLTDSRGGLGVSGLFAGPPVNVPIASLTPLADAGEIDRTDSLLLLHDSATISDEFDPASRLEVIRIALSTQDLRFSDLTRASAVLWACVAHKASTTSPKPLAEMLHNQWTSVVRYRVPRSRFVSAEGLEGYEAITSVLAWLISLDEVLRKRSRESTGGNDVLRQVLASAVCAGLCEELLYVIFGQQLNKFDGVLDKHLHVVHTKILLVRTTAAEICGSNEQTNRIANLPSSRVTRQIDSSLSELTCDFQEFQRIQERANIDDGYYTSELRACFHEAVARLSCQKHPGQHDPLDEVRLLFKRLVDETRKISKTTLADVIDLLLPHENKLEFESNNGLAERVVGTIVQLCENPAEIISRRPSLVFVVFDQNTDFIREPLGVGVPGLLGIQTSKSQSESADIAVRIDFDNGSEGCVPNRTDWQVQKSKGWEKHTAPLNLSRVITPFNGGFKPRDLQQSKGGISTWIADAFERLCNFEYAQRKDGTQPDGVCAIPTAWNLLRTSEQPLDPPSEYFSHIVKKNEVGSQAFHRSGKVGLQPIPISSFHADLWRIGTAIADVLNLLDASASRSILANTNEESELGEWSTYTIIRLALRRLRGINLPNREFRADEDYQNNSVNGVKLPRTITRVLKALRDFPDAGEGTADERLAFVLQFIAENRAFEFRFERDVVLNAQSSGNACAMAFLIAQQVFRADDDYSEELPNAPVDNELVLARRPPLAWIKLGQRLQTLRLNLAEQPGSRLAPLIACCYLASATYQIRMQTLESWTTISDEEQLALEKVELDLSPWDIDESATFVTNDPSTDNTSTEKSNARPNTWELFAILGRVCKGHVINTAESLSRITPLGWLVALGTVSGILRSKSQRAIRVLDLSGFHESHERFDALVEATKQLANDLAIDFVENDNLPWGDLQNVIQKWSDPQTIQRHCILFRELDKIAGLDVRTAKSAYLSISDGRGSFREVTSSKGRRRINSWQIFSAMVRGEKKQHGVEKLIGNDDSYESLWSETWRNGKLLSVGTVYDGLASLSGLAVGLPAHSKTPTDPADELLKEGNAEQTSEQAIDNLESQASHQEPAAATDSSKTNKDAKSNKQTISSASGKSESELIGWLDDQQKQSWSLREKAPCHLRVALFQFSVDDSYRHPIFETCMREGINDADKMPFLRKLREFIKSNQPEFWEPQIASGQYGTKDREGVPSCAELRRQKLLDSVLKACAALKVDALLLPEYSVRPETIAYLETNLKNLAPGTCVWAGTYRLPPGGKFSNEGKADQEDLIPWQAKLHLVSENTSKSRPKKYPASALGEQFNPRLGEPISPLFTVENAAKNNPYDLRLKILELICSEIFIVLSPSNIDAAQIAVRKLIRQLGDTSQDLEAEIERSLNMDLRGFGASTSLARNHMERRSVLFVPAMSTRAVDYAVLGQAGYLAAGLTTVFCNAAKNHGNGQSCFIGHDGWDKEGKNNDEYPSGGPYHGVFPGIYRPFEEGRGWLGSKEQALVVADIDPCYSMEGKPRPQLLLQPLTLVAHLPVVEWWTTGKTKSKQTPEHARINCRCSTSKQGEGISEFLQDLNRLVSTSGKQRNTVDKFDFNEARKVLTGLEKAAKQDFDGSWLRKRTSAFLRNHIASPTAWPSAAFMDWLFVRIDPEGDEIPLIEIPPYSRWEDQDTKFPESLDSNEIS